MTQKLYINFHPKFIDLLLEGKKTTTLQRKLPYGVIPFEEQEFICTYGGDAYLLLKMVYKKEQVFLKDLTQDQVQAEGFEFLAEVVEFLEKSYSKKAKIFEKPLFLMHILDVKIES